MSEITVVMIMLVLGMLVCAFFAMLNQIDSTNPSKYHENWTTEAWALEPTCPGHDSRAPLNNPLCDVCQRVFHNGQCYVCGKPLTDPDFIGGFCDEHQRELIVPDWFRNDLI